MKGIKLNFYSIHARAFPIYITILPVAFSLFPILPEGLNWKFGGAIAIFFLPLSYLFSQIGGDWGKKIERDLWDSWGGPPTTRFLRHCNNEFNANTRNRIHAKLRSLEFHIPSCEEQGLNSKNADAYYESCIDEIRRRTRDNNRFPLVFKGLTEYGFRRNLLGLKNIGLLLTVVSLMVCLVSVFVSWDPAKPPFLDVIAGLLNIGLLLIWCFWVTEKTIKLTAERYARFLLEAILNLEVKDGGNSFPKC